MPYPLISEYIEAIKSAEDNFEELSCLRTMSNLSINQNSITRRGRLRYSSIVQHNIITSLWQKNI